MDELCYLPARVLAHRLRNRELTAIEVLDTYAERIARVDPSLNAVVSADFDQARQAAAADRALARGEPPGPLHGVPVIIKDGHDVAGLRTTVGTAAFDRIPERDGTIAARLRAAGTIILGHSNVPPFLADYRTDNAIFGRTNNPWDLHRTPGGSSGGAAAALAAGLTPIEVGSDYGGSLRLPPHFCGVYGLMATEHRVPTTGFWRPKDDLPRSVRILLSLGPMTRDLADLELVLHVIAGPDGHDNDVPPVPLRDRHRLALRGLRLAAVPALPGATIATSLRAEIERIAAQASNAGARVEDRLPNVDWQEQQLSSELMAAVTDVFHPGARLPDEHRGLAWYLTALDRRDHFISAWEDFFGAYDALILPPATTTAFGHDSTADTGQERQLVFANLAGLPALTAPAGHDEAGLPIGVQIIGPRWSEIRLLEIAVELEEAGILPGFTTPPSPGPAARSRPGPCRVPLRWCSTSERIVASAMPAAARASTNPASTSVSNAASSSGPAGARTSRRSRTTARLNPGPRLHRSSKTGDPDDRASGNRELFRRQNRHESRKKALVLGLDSLQGLQGTLGLSISETPPGYPTTHRSLNQASQLRALPDLTDIKIKIIRRDRLGGLLQEYAQVA